MSTIKSSNEHLTLNADGSSKGIKFQANGVEKASISSSGAFTSTTIDATKLTGTIPNFTSTGIDDNADATAMTIDSSERVGIGTGSPTARLHVYNADDHVRLSAQCAQNTGQHWQFQSRNNGEFWLRNDDHSRNDVVVYPSNGAVTMPNQPSVVLGGSVGGYTTVNASSVAPFNNIETQTGGSNYNTSTYRYTAPVAGWYHVTFHALSQSEIEQEWLLRKNANTIRRHFQPTGSIRCWSFSTQVYCAVNDYLDIESNTSNSNNIYMSSGGNMYSWVSYRLLG